MNNRSENGRPSTTDFASVVAAVLGLETCNEQRLSCNYAALLYKSVLTNKNYITLSNGVSSIIIKTVCY